MSAPDPTVSQPSIPKFSRYRSVRRAFNARANAASSVNAIPEVNEEEAEEESLDLDVQDIDGEGMSQSRSRYKRSKNTTSLNAIEAQVSGSTALQNSNNHNDLNATTAEGQPRQKQPSARYHGRSKEKDSQHAKGHVESSRGPEEDRRVQEKAQAAEAQRQEQEAQDRERILAEQKRQDLKRLEAELDAATPAEQATSPREKFGFLSRKFGTTKTLPRRKVESADQPVPTIARARTQKVTKKIIGAPLELGSPLETVPIGVVSSERKSSVKETDPIKQGGGNIVPQTDVPVSASNAGDRVSHSIEHYLMYFVLITT